VEDLGYLVKGMNASLTSGIPGEGWGNEAGAVVGISHDPDMDGDAAGGTSYTMAGRIGHQHTFGDKGTPNPVPKPSAFYTANRGISTVAG
jgi:hypothetical protein